MNNWKNQETDWCLMYEMSYLSYLVYDYMKYWKVNQLDNLNQFFENESNNKNLDDYDKTLLLNLKSKYPQGEVLKFFTNSVDFQCVVGKNSHKKRIPNYQELLLWLYKESAPKISELTLCLCFYRVEFYEDSYFISNIFFVAW